MRCHTAVAIALLGVWPMAAWAYQISTFPADVPIVASGTLEREPAQKGEGGGLFQSPWTSVKVFVLLARAISVGDAVTVLPLGRGLPPVQAKATSVQFQEGVPGELSDLWLVHVDVGESAFFTARPDRHRADDRPFDALVIYPARSQARLLAPVAVAKDLPPERGCSKRTLRAAVDLDADAKADVTMFEFCCERPASLGSSRRCANTCQATYLRRGRQPWRVVEKAKDD